MSDVILVRPDTGEYLAATAPHPRSLLWDDDPDAFFTEDIEKAQSFGTGLWANQYIHRCPPLCSLGDQATKRDHEHIIVYAISREHVGNNFPILIPDPLREFIL